MAFVFFEGVAEVTKTSGTGNYTLLGALPNSFTLGSKMMTGDEAYFDISLESGPGREIILGTFTSPNILARTAIVSSSNADAAVNWGTTGQRFVKMIRRPDVLYEIPFFIPHIIEGGNDDNRSRVRILTTQGASYLSDFAGSLAFSRVDATADIDFEINSVDSSNSVINIGTMSISAGNNVASFVSVGGSAQTVVAGNCLEVLAPATADLTLADLAINILGKRLT